MARSAIGAVARLAVYVGFAFLCMPVQLVGLAVSPALARRWPVVFHRTCLRILGVQVMTEGAMIRKGPVLFVANHQSYLDILVLGSLVPGSFVSKADVKDWPFFGLLAKLQRSVFVERRRHQAKANRSEIESRLAEGDSLILFPEGTSSDGNRVLGFKSALLSVAERGEASDPLPIQPVSIAYVSVNGMPIGRTWRPFVAWYGDMDLAGHLWSFARLGLVRVVVEFHPPLTLQGSGSRKALAQACRERVVDGMTKALRPRLDLLPHP
jgi:1-acyl-sn-glycerol-3-phosphate acyltransferase